MTFRAFVAVDLDEGFRGAGLLPGLCDTGADLKPVRPANMHITLKFLGEMAEERVADVTGAMEAAVEGQPPFEVRFRGMGAFPGLSRIRVLWVGIEGAEPLASIARRLDDDLSKRGFGREKEGFSPHITVARLRSPRRMEALRAFLEANASGDFGAMRVGSIALKQSVLGPGGPSYSTVRAVPLGESAH